MMSPPTKTLEELYRLGKRGGNNSGCCVFILIGIGIATVVALAI